MASVIFACFVAGCAHDASVPDNSGTSNQELQKRKDGSATGDGKTCSWENTTTFETCSSPYAPVPTYELGDEFKSIDGCNECACTEKGIMCTVRTCGGEPGSVPPSPPASPPPSPPIACDASLRICKDGSPAKPLPDSCKQVCPEDFGSGGTACTDDAMKCPDGSYVGRTGPNCEFAPCPAAK